jgi:hypothetical protein
MEEVDEGPKKSSSSSLIPYSQSEDGTYRTLETNADNTLELVPYNKLKRYKSASEIPVETAFNTVPMKEVDGGPEKSSNSSLVPYLQSKDGTYRTLETNTQSEEAYSTLEMVPYSTLEVVPYNMPKCYRSASEMQWPDYDTPVPPNKGNIILYLDYDTRRYEH